MKKTILSLLLACSLLSLFAQELKHCGADELRISALKQMPEVARAVIRRDEELEAFTKKFVSAANHKDDAEYVIPVVFHVIHNYGPENISNAQILDGIDVLNKTFRKLLADTGSLVEEFKPLHADTKIEFRLATKDPDGNCHSGINRIASALTTKGDHSVKTLVHWPQNKYLNIYIVAQAAGLAGHCVWPADADTIPEWDGIVVGYNYVGSIEQSDYTRSVALAHECGHYLNLHHIWGGNNVPGFYYLPCGDVNKDCSIDDLVADTPPTIGWQTCNLNAKSCGSSRDMVQNVMDYSYCNRVFTTGQKLRMQACLNSPIAGRNNLWSQSNRLATGTLNAAPLCAADFGSSRGVICQGDGASVVFSDLSYGSGGSNTFSWSFEGGTPAVSSQRNPTVTYAAAGTYAVSLTVGDGSNSYTITRDHFITVLPEQGAAYPLSESFEQLDSLEGSGWMGASQDPGAGWEITSAAAYTGTKSVRLANFGSLEPTSDQFYGKTTDLSGVTGPVRLTFRYAYAKSSADDKTSATIYFASDCNTLWQKRSQLSTLSMITSPVVGQDFVPNGVSEWKQASVNVTSNFFETGFNFRIDLASAESNNFYIDDINIDLTANAVDELEELRSSLNIYPNPASSVLNIEFEQYVPREAETWLTDVVGKTVTAPKTITAVTGTNHLSTDVSALTAGFYTLHLKTAGGTVTRSFVVQP